VYLPASCDSAIRRLCFELDIELRAINVMDKESFIHSVLRRYPVASEQSPSVCALDSTEWPISIQRGCYCIIKLSYFHCRLHPPPFPDVL
jgi:hypothetical protein